MTQQLNVPLLLGLLLLVGTTTCTAHSAHEHEAPHGGISSLSTCSVASLPGGRPASPLLFGLNDILGPIINLTYSDTALVAAVKALRVGALRHPGGTVANYWSMAAGSYVGQDGTTPGCNGSHWNYCKYEDRIQDHPPQTFSAKSFADGVGSELAATVHDLNVLTMSTAQSIAELHALAAAGVIVTHLELGNEFYITKNYAWRFPTAARYAEACLPVVVAARKLFPHVRIAVVGADRSDWNTELAKQSALMKSVDSVTIHHYGPNPTKVTSLPAAQQRTALAADGEFVSASMAASIRDSFINEGHVHLTLWRTEYNYPGGWVGPLPAMYEPEGGMHALFMAGHVLSALEHQAWAVPFEVLMMHCLAHQPSAGWSSSNSTVLIVGDSSGDPSAVRVGAVAQVFAHLADSALKQHGTVHSASLSAGCPAVDLKAHGNISCIQATVFAGEEDGSAGTMTFVLMNRCEATVGVAVAGRVKTSTSYLAGDKGGWAPLPPPGSSVPWSAPLAPSKQACAVGSAACALPPVSLTLVDVASVERLKHTGLSPASTIRSRGA
eukprot:COSAG02_NODE_634_length_19259_cov_9.871347_10_plen_553_part_00